MEKVAVTGARAGSSKERRFGACAAVALGILACAPGWAQESRQPADQVLAQAPVDAPVLEVQTSRLPRLEAQDVGFQGDRVDMTLFPSRGSGLGAMVGVSGFAPRPGVGIQPYGLQPRPGVDVGLRFSSRVQNQQVDVMAWRRVNNEPDAYTLIQMRQPVYGARVEMDLSGGRKSGFAMDRGFLGLQLQSGARISIKRKNGGPMVYYRTTF